MTKYRPAPEPITAEWVASVLRDAGALASGTVIAVASRPTSAFNSHTSHLQISYSADSAPGLAPRMVLKRNIPEPWGIEAGIEEVKFYRLIAGLPTAAPCSISVASARPA